MSDKVLFIGTGPREIDRVLRTCLANGRSSVVRHSLDDAMPDLAAQDDIRLILTRPELLVAALSDNHARDLSSDETAELLKTDTGISELVGDSEQIQEVCAQIGQVAGTDSTVLIEGENGTGKELIARAIHVHSTRAGKPLIAVNCAALPEQLIESELFGHVRGAFTGAVRNRKGRFLQADGGTILLDEIGSLPLASQAKLLGVLQERSFEPVGQSETVSVDVRVIATDNSNLANAVEQGRFRQDLYYRLNVFPITAPPLRCRKGDIELIARHFLRKFANLNRCVTAISREAMSAMCSYGWPGNVRQLENAMQHALIVETAPHIRPQSLPINFDEMEPVPVSDENDLSLRRQLQRYEKTLVREALRRSEGSKKRAAELLGVNPKNLSYLLHKHDLH